MSERKPPGMTFPSWVDQQISEAAERGAFDNLPGAGQPLRRRREGEDDGQTWLREYLRKEGVPADVLLPEPLKLRKEAARLAETVATFPSEQDVRDAVAELNHRIIQWRRIPIGPPIFVALVNEDRMLARWRDGQEGTGLLGAAPGNRSGPVASTPPEATAGSDAEADAEVDASGRRAASRAGQSASRASRTRWWRRGGRNGR